VPTSQPPRKFVLLCSFSLRPSFSFSKSFPQQVMEEQDVRKQLERMRKFILDEAQNKRLEILQSAEEEANREKDRLIRQGEMGIIKDLERKAKQVEVAKKM
jgi:hypothetical protein